MTAFAEGATVETAHAGVRVTALPWNASAALWRSLEAEGIMTPYQRRAWIEAYAGADGSVADVNLVVARDEAGRVRLAAPLLVRRRFGLRIATMPGGKHANFQMPILPATGCMPGCPAQAWRFLAAAAKALGGVDLFLLQNQPLGWAGTTNPLALIDSTPSPSQAYKLFLDDDPEETLKRVLSRDTRKKLRQKRNRLEALGDVRHVVASSHDEREGILAAFYHQKAARMREIGAPDPFSEPTTRAFLHEAVRPGADGLPAIELHGLSVGGRYVATFAGTVHGDRFCGMFNAFDMAPEFFRASPGDLLLMDVIAHYGRLGLKVFDLGIGEARYKDTFCEAVEPVTDTIHGITPAGRAASLALRGAIFAKRRIKRSPAAMALVKRLRRKDIAA